MEPRTLEKKKMNPLEFWIPVVILASVIIIGAIFPSQVGSVMNDLLYGMVDYFGWYINLLSLVLLILTLVFIIRKYGDIKIGGRDAKPKFTTFQWIAMTICGGIGTGLLFWAMGAMGLSR